MVSYMQPNMEEPGDGATTIAGSEGGGFPRLADAKMSSCWIMGKMPEGWQKPVR